MYGRRGLVRRRPLLRAAAVGGTFAAGRAMGRRSAEQASAEEDQDQRIADLEGQQGQPQMQAAQPAQGTGTPPASAADQLSQLAGLHEQGALTDEEFAAAKARILGSS
ncbi:MAG: SHOCT domain-containing protein [Streptosporangiaceae bacterium]